MTHSVRKPRLALLAGVLMPGLGQLYLGDFVQPLCCLLGVAFAVPGAVRLALAAPPKLLCWVVFAGVLLAVALYVWSAWDAWRSAKRAAEPALHSWQRPTVYLLYVIVAYSFVLAPCAANVRRELLETFVVPSASMTPGILPGDRVLADKTVGQTGGTKLWRGALAIFIYPNDRTATFVKRVIGLPGDHIELDERGVRVNGRDLSAGSPQPAAQSESGTVRAVTERGDHGAYTVLWPTNTQPRGDAPASASFVVPDGQIFVLGDNRAASVDSRRFGTVPLADVKAVARQVWFSSAHGDVRWGRVGKVLDQ